MVFVVDPPASVGRVLSAWTNNGPNGPKPVPWSERALGAGMGALTGFVLGLVGVFVVGGVLEERGTEVSADAFLFACAAGALVGLAVAVLRGFRRPGVNSLFVGDAGCAEIHTRDGRSETRLTAFADVEGFRSHVSTMTAQGIRTSIRELHVRTKDGKEKLWLVSAPPGTATAEDPQCQYCEAVVRAFEAHRARTSGS